MLIRVELNIDISLDCLRNLNKNTKSCKFYALIRYNNYVKIILNYIIYSIFII